MKKAALTLLPIDVTLSNKTMKKLYRFLRKWWNGRQTVAPTLHGSGHSFTEGMEYTPGK